MPGKTPNSNGNEPLENSLRGNTNDADMKDAKGKKASKDGDDEMTVVLPPSKSSKHSSHPQDADGDVSMDDEDKADDGEAEVDPAVQTVAGKQNSPTPRRRTDLPFWAVADNHVVDPPGCRH